MTWLALAQYLRANWRPFLTVSALGVAAGSLLPPWLLAKDSVRDWLTSEAAAVHIGIFALTTATLLLGWPRALNFWRRYRNTQALHDPPLQHVDLFASGLFVGLATGYSHIVLSATQPLISNAAYVTLLALLSSFFSWLVISWAWSLKDRSIRVSDTAFARKEGDYFDDPITRDEEDLLGRVPFVNRLSEQIIQLPSPNSFVFGLYGGWGEGKTSVLTLLQHRIAKSPNVITVHFNPWYFADETALTRAFYSRIEEELSHLYILSGLHRTITRYKHSLTSAFGYFGIQIPIADDPEQLRTELESWILRIGHRLVIIIDDIDRLQPGEMITVLKLARLSARLRNTVFLLSFDHLVVIETLKKSSGLEPEFLDKIIQKPIALPPAEQRDIDRFLLFSDPGGPLAHRSAIDRLLDELEVEPTRRKEFDDQFAFFYQTVARRLFITIRHAKRYINALRTALPPIIGEINLHDFFLLELLHIFYPKIYKDIWSNPWFYLPPWAQEIFLVYPFARVSSHDEKYSLILEHVKSFLQIESQQEIAQEILKKLFFEVDNALKTHGRMQHENEADTYLVNKRLTHPKCFAKYFLFRIPIGEFADHLVETLIARWNSATDTETAVTDDLYQYREMRQLALLFEKLRIFRNLISVHRVPGIVRGVARIVPDISSIGTDPWDSERYRAETFLLSLINDRSDPAEVERIVREVVANIKSFPFVVSVVYECGNRAPGRYFRIYEKVNITSLRKLASERLTEHFVQGRRDIFTDIPGRDLAFVLHQWATNWETDTGDNRLIVQNYVMSLVELRPEYLGQLLSAYRSRSLSGEYTTFEYQPFKRAFDPVIVAEHLASIGEDAATTAESKEVVKLFREQYDAEKNHTEEIKK